MGVAEATLAPIKSIKSHRFNEDYAPKLTMARNVKQMLRQLHGQTLKLGLISNQREPLQWLTIELGIIEHFGFTHAIRKSAAALRKGCGVHPEEAIQVGKTIVRMDQRSGTRV